MSTYKVQMRRETDGVNDNLKVLLVDDMLTQRHILTKAMSDVQGIEMIGTAPNGKIALAKMDALETLIQIK